MERNVPAGSRVTAVRAQRISALPAQPPQALDLGYNLLRPVLPYHPHAGVDCRHDLPDVAGFGGREQPHGSGFAPGGAFGRRDAVEHPMHPVRNLPRPLRADRLVRQILVFHICSHSQLPADFAFRHDSQSIVVRRRTRAMGSGQQDQVNGTRSTPVARRSLPIEKHITRNPRSTSASASAPRAASGSMALAAGTRPEAATAAVCPTRPAP